jgi:hypothetical protein
MKFIESMLVVLGIIGMALLLISTWFFISVSEGGTEDITFKFSLLAFLTGLSYILFIVIILKLLKK